MTPSQSRPSKLCLTVAALLAAPLAAAADGDGNAPGEVVHLWPATMLTPDPKKPERSIRSQTKAGRGILRVSDVSDPTITIRRPAGRTEATPAVVVCPGGGYSILAWDLEGTEVVEWLNSIGIAGALLKYRVPGRRDAAFQDAQRAVRIVRHRARQWNIDPNRVGILGFSAGGHLSARLCTNFGRKAYERIDEADDVSCRPDFGVLIYPAYLATKGDAALDANALPVSPQTPGTFVAIAFNDRFTAGALHYFLALRTARVPSELHVFQFGGHGCGLRSTGDSVTTWPAHCERWLRGMGVLPRPNAERAATGGP